MSKYITVQELASLKKPKPTSRQNVNQLANKGKLPFVEKDGKKMFDTTNEIIISWLNSTPQKSAKKPVKQKKEKPQSEKKQKSETKQKKSPPPVDIDQSLINLIESGDLTYEHAISMTKTELEKIKIYEQIKKTKIDAEIKRGEYIHKKIAQTYMHKLYEVDRAQLIPLRDRLVIDLSEIFQVQDDTLKVKASEKIDSELFDYLASIQKIMNDFLLSHEAETVK